MPQFEPSLLQQLGPENVEGFGKAIGNILKPNFEFQQAMHKAIAGNPKLAQEFRDLEANAPGTLSAMGFGAVGDVINMMPESQENEFSRKNRGEIIDKEKQKLDIQHSEQGITIQRLNDIVHFLKDPANAAVKADVILQKLGVGITDVRRREKAAADVEEAEVGLKKAQAGKAMEQYERMLKNRPNLANIDFLGLAKDFISGKVKDSSAMANILSDPEMRETMERAISAAREQNQDSFREYQENQRLDRADARQLGQDAFRAYEASGRVGTFAAWKTVIGNPEAASKSTDLNVQAAIKANQDLQDKMGFSQMQPVINDITKFMSNIATLESKGAPEADIQVDKAQLQTALNRKAQLQGSDPIFAQYGRKPGVGETQPHAQFSPYSEGEGLYFTDNAGKRIADAQALAKPDAKIKLADLSPDELNAYSVINKMSKAEQKIQLDRMQKLKPETYNRLKGFFNQ